MGTYLILAALLSVCSFSFSQECRRGLQDNMDFPGTDITNVYSPDAEHCQRLCTEHPSCLFFTFIRHDWTNDQRNFYCYLKYTPAGRPNIQKPVLGVTSGYSLKSCSPEPLPCLSRVYQNVDFFGADYRTLFVADYEDCQRVCTQDTSCQFFTFVNNMFTPETLRYKCHLKFSWTVPKSPIVEKKPGVVSGFSDKAQMSPSSDRACQGKLFPNADIPQNDLESMPSASPQHCLALCSAHPKCTYFSFDRNTFNCQLKNNPNTLVIKAKEGVTSGIPARSCQLDDKWLKDQYEGVDFTGSDIRYELLDDPVTCQRTCNENANCQFYAYVRNSFRDVAYRRRCYHKRVITIPAPPKVAKLDNVVSGFSLTNCV